VWVNASQGKLVLLKFKFDNGSNPRWVNPVMSWPTMNRTKCQYWWLYQQVLQSFLLFWFYVDVIVSLRIFKEYHIYNWLLNIKKLSSAYDFRWYYHTSEFFKIISTVCDFSSGINYIYHRKAIKNCKLQDGFQVQFFQLFYSAETSLKSANQRKNSLKQYCRTKKKI
jgi:hypothetical protein